MRGPTESGMQTKPSNPFGGQPVKERSFGPCCKKDTLPGDRTPLLLVRRQVRASCDVGTASSDPSTSSRSVAFTIPVVNMTRKSRFPAPCSMSPGSGFMSHLPEAAEPAPGDRIGGFTRDFGRPEGLTAAPGRAHGLRSGGPRGRGGRRVGRGPPVSGLRCRCAGEAPHQRWSCRHEPGPS